MRIIGSSKIDDYKKASLEESVLKAINAKPGDSILFYRKRNDTSICISRAEGAHITSEADAPTRNHMRGAFDRLRQALIASIILQVLVLFIVAIHITLFPLGSMLMILLSVFCIYLSRIVDKPYDTNTLVTIGGPFSKNKLIVLSRLTSDGVVVTGDMFTNTLFGSNPSSVNVRAVLDSGREITGDAKRVRFAPGYSVYKLLLKESELSAGTLIIDTLYDYIGKNITVTSTFKMDLNEDKEGILITEGELTAAFEFEGGFNSPVYDDVVLDESDQETGAI